MFCDIFATIVELDGLRVDHDEVSRTRVSIPIMNAVK